MTGGPGRRMIQPAGPAGGAGSGAGHAAAAVVAGGGVCSPVVTASRRRRRRCTRVMGAGVLRRRRRRRQQGGPGRRPGPPCWSSGACCDGDSGCRPPGAQGLGSGGRARGGRAGGAAPAPRPGCRRWGWTGSPDLGYAVRRDRRIARQPPRRGYPARLVTDKQRRGAGVRHPTIAAPLGIGNRMQYARHDTARTRPGKTSRWRGSAPKIVAAGGGRQAKRAYGVRSVRRPRPAGVRGEPAGAAEAVPGASRHSGARRPGAPAAGVGTDVPARSGVWFNG